VWFVEQPEFGAPSDEARKCGPSALAGAQGADPDIAEPVGEPHPAEGRIDLGSGRAHGRPPEGHVVGDGEVGVEPVGMAEETHMAAHRHTVERQIVAEHLSLATLDREEPGTHPEQRGLAGSVRALQEQDLPSGHGKVGACQHGEATLNGNDPAEINDRVGHVRHANGTGEPHPRRAPDSVGRVTGDRRRVPYFDRPKHPHDWRWWVGLLGRSMIVLGLLVFAFVAYQLWGTGIRTAQAQNRLDQQFTEALAGTSTSTSTTTTVVVDTTEGNTTSTSSTLPVAPYNGAIAEGTPIARLRIESISLDWTVVEGVTSAALEDGPGHFPESPMPGQYGNAAIAGHRTTHGEPFRNLDRVEPGDLIEVTTLDGIFTYVVTGSEIVLPTEYSRVVPTTDPTKATLVLATCHPAFSTKQRLIIHADLVPEQSGLVLQPSSVTSTTAPDSTTTTAALPGESTVPAETTPDTAPAVVDPLAGAGPAEGDAFTNGWFHDSAAWPHVAGWGLLLVLVSFGSFLAGRAVRRLYVCYLVGALPFVVVLYFFFENVARLLPPGL
jgi:sortase A